MTTNTNNTGAHMKQNSTNQTGSRLVLRSEAASPLRRVAEAPDSSVRPAKSALREAHRAARRLRGGFAYQQDAAQVIARVLTAFGGHVIAVENKKQAAA